MNFIECSQIETLIHCIPDVQDYRYTLNISRMWQGKYDEYVELLVHRCRNGGSGGSSPPPPPRYFKTDYYCENTFARYALCTLIKS